jgi:phosphohistidine phosphatase
MDDDASMSDTGIVIYFLRHGVAAKRSDWSEDDDLRPLTDDGKAAMARAAVALTRLGIAPDAIVTSPLTRARQTAAIVGEALGVADKVVDDARLAHGFDRAALAAIVADHVGPEAGEIMVVGHEPEFSATIGELTGAAVACKKGSLTRVDVADRRTLSGVLVWLLQPKVLGL